MKIISIQLCLFVVINLCVLCLSQSTITDAPTAKETTELPTSSKSTTAESTTSIETTTSTTAEPTTSTTESTTSTTAEPTTSTTESTTIPTTTPSPSPSAVKELKKEEVTSKGCIISWIQPDIFPDDSSYHITVKYAGCNHYIPDICTIHDDTNIELDIVDTKYNFTEGFPDYYYIAEVYAWNKIGKSDSKSLSNIVTTQDDAPTPDKLDGQCNDIDDGYNIRLNCSISWQYPCEPNSDLSFQIVMESFYNLNENKTTVTNYPIKHANEPIYTFNIPNLQYYYNYTIYLASVGENLKQSENRTYTFLTSANYPRIPENVQLEENDDLARISWKNSVEEIGKIDNYTIEIQSLGPAEGGFDCDPNTDKIKNVSSDQSYEFKMKPFYKYNVSVLATNEIGNSKPNVKILSTTARDPDPVSNLSVIVENTSSSVYDAYAILQFSQPCRSNGKFENYKVAGYGTRPGYSDVTITLDSIINNNVTIPLVPQFEYTLSVTISTNTAKSESLPINFTAPPGIPKQNPDRSIDSPTTSTTTTEVIFILRKGYFLDDNGENLYYAILLDTTNITTAGEYGFWNGTEESWPDTQSSAIYITPEMWNPFKGNMTSFSMILGSGKCKEDYCTISLEESTRYFMVVRVFTSETYLDSNVISFVTGELKSIRLAVILGSIFGFFAAATVIIILVMMWQKKHKNSFLFNAFNRHERFDSTRDSKSSPLPEKKNKSVIFPEKLEDIQEIEEPKEIEMTDTQLEEEFSGIQNESNWKFQERSTADALSIENRKKNRYINILPYDSTRVKLTPDKDNDGTDYINASYIKGYSGKEEYIASQAPKKETCRDFWRMIIFEDVTIILMLCQYYESERQKCYEYMEIDEKDLSVTIAEENEADFYIRRKLNVKLIEGNDTFERSIIHYQFIHWPDFGIPKNTSEMINLCEIVRNRFKSGKMLVHCSAGVGRSGTYITLDIIIQQIKDKKKYNLSETVMQIRNDRPHMVQTAEQYKYIYRCIQDFNRRFSESSDT